MENQEFETRIKNIYEVGEKCKYKKENIKQCIDYILKQPFQKGDKDWQAYSNTKKMYGLYLNGDMKKTLLYPEMYDALHFFYIDLKGY